MNRNQALELANEFYTGGASEREVAFARRVADRERERVLAAFSSYEVQLRSMGVALQADGLPTRDIDAQLEALRVLREAVRRD